MLSDLAAPCNTILYIPFHLDEHPLPELLFFVWTVKYPPPPLGYWPIVVIDWIWPNQEPLNADDRLQRERLTNRCTEEVYPLLFILQLNIGLGSSDAHRRSPVRLQGVFKVSDPICRKRWVLQAERHISIYILCMFASRRRKFVGNNCDNADCVFYTTAAAIKLCISAIL